MYWVSKTFDRCLHVWKILYLSVLENSEPMAVNNTWRHIRIALQKFINRDLPEEAQLGLVLFNEDAYIASSVTRLGNDPASRKSISVHIESRYTLSPNVRSCVRCGLVKAIEALQTSGSTKGKHNSQIEFKTVISRLFSS